ncbi:hypothetical protein JQ553_16820 [Bradyrhizobium lablabi]|nr:hypothetical protein [Bradyrhizobium lablabi]
METVAPATRDRFRLLVLMLFHITVTCISLIRVATYQTYVPYDPQHLLHAVVVVAAFSLVSILFAVVRFSFGYFVGFYLYTMVLGFLWMNSFTRFNYNHGLGALSAAVSAIVFLLPAMLINTSAKQIFVLSRRDFERLLDLILLITVATFAVASIYHFKLVSLGRMYEFRDELQYPAVIRYLIGIAPNVLLPLAFASYLALKRYWRAALTLLLYPLFYPISLSKLAFFSPAWVLAIWAASKAFEARTVAILSLFVPALIGVVFVNITESGPLFTYFDVVNSRMIATPSSAMDIYNDFFASHPLTHFCQISIVRAFLSCPYQEPLAVVMKENYGWGNLNASLFATEGVASVGLYFAPIVALACGLIVAIGNRASAGLPPSFILISASILPQIFLNVPLTVVMVTHGTALLFLIWYIMPRSIFGQASHFD